MRIAIFHELPLTSGSRKSVDIIANLLSKKNTVDLYYVDRKPTYIAKLLPFSVHFYKFVPVEWNGGDAITRLYRDSFELVKLFLLHRKIASHIRNKKYDVLFIHGSFLTESPFVLQFSNIFKIYYAHAPNYTLVFEKVMGIPKVDRVRYVYEYLNRLVRRAIDKKNVRSASLIFANSQFTRNKISAFYGRKSLVSYLGVDTKVYKPLNVRKKYDYLFVGSYHPVDGYGLIHQAMEFMKKKPSYKILAIENEWIQDDIEMAKLYNSARIVLCLSHQEPFGLVAIEAGACGVPVIAINEAGYKETVVHGKTGLLIKRTPDELAKAITSLLRSKKKLEKLSMQARVNAVEKWSWNVRVQDMEDKIKKSIS